jgi:nucleotide-binding universal stress UspA family protein
MFKNILLTLDGSEMAEQALRPAIQFAQCFQAELIILRVMVPLAKSFRGGSASISVIETAQNELRTMASEYLQDLEAKIEMRDISVRTVLREGNPSQEILKFMENNQIDLVVICTRGETGVTRWLLGSVTDHVVRGTKVPVIVVPAKEKAE